jgi:AcrR family transcriptional regulator
MSDRKKQPKYSGRPVNDADVRNSLLDAAARCLTRKPFAQVGIRELAAEAGVTSAMIHHYFGSKTGLYKEMILSRFLPIVESMEQLSPEKEDLQTIQVDPVQIYLEKVTKQLSENPWMVSVIVQEVFTEGSELREFFLHNIVSRMKKIMPDLLGKSIKNGKYRADLRPEHLMITVVSLAVFPHIFARIAGQEMGLNMDAEFFQVLADHNFRVFKEGVAAGQTLYPPVNRGMNYEKN